MSSPSPLRVWILLLLAAGLPVHGHAAPSEATRREAVALQVGPRRVTVGELEARLARIHPLQLERFGTTKEERVRGFVEQVVVRELLLTLGAGARAVSQTPLYAHEEARIRAQATLRAQEQQLPRTVSHEEIKAYYEAHRSDFSTPARTRLWRILVATREEAHKLLELLHKDPTPAHFQALAREQSLDKATYLRGGDLGFVTDEGIPRDAGRKVEQALVDAARKVPDGAFVPTPVPEGNYFAVVWRRGSVTEKQTSLQEAEPYIREKVWQNRRTRAVQDLLAQLRIQHLAEVHEEAIPHQGGETSLGNR